MKESRRVLPYGNSSIRKSIVASLRRLSQHEVPTLNPHLHEGRKLDAAIPDPHLFIFETSQAEAFFYLYKTNPSLLLMDISPDINLVKIWSGRQIRELLTQGLLELIKSEGNHLSVKLGGDEDNLY